MENRAKIKLFFISLGILFFGASCSAQANDKPNISHQLDSCGESRVLDLEPGDIVNLTDAGKGKSDFSITGNGEIFDPGVSNQIITDPNAVRYIIGDQDRPPYYVVKSTGTGNGDVIIEKFCPVKPATPTPRPSPTPYSHLGEGSGKLASLPRGFHPDVRASKPVPVYRNRRG